MPELTCGRCNIRAVPDLYWHPTSNPDVTHLGARCPSCGRYIQWVPQTPEWLEQAPIQAPQGKLL